MSDILVLAALPEEAAALFPGEGVVADGPVVPVRRLDVKGRSLAIATCGLGKVNAALASGLLAADMRPDMLIMTGTCGGLTDHPPQAWWIAEAVQHDYGSARAGEFVAYRGGTWPMGPAGTAHFTAMADPGIGLAHARIASGDAFVECPERAAWLAGEIGATLVDMEVAAVAQVAERLGLPWAAIKATTDAANGDSAGDFQANLARAAREAAAAVERLIAMV